MRRPAARALRLLPVLAGCLAIGLWSAVSKSVYGDDDSPEIVRLGEGDLLVGPPGDGPLSRAQAEAWIADARNHRPLAPVLPLGLAAGGIGAAGLDGPGMTRAKIELGRQLFFDKRISSDGAVSCASCHSPDHGFAFPTRRGVGAGGQVGRRNSPTAANRQLAQFHFWDGRAASLEEQALGPIANPSEMGFGHESLVAFCTTNAAYRVQFESVFADGVTPENAGAALAAFERALVSGPSAWDVDSRLKLVNQSISDGDDDPELLAERDRLAISARDNPLSPAARRGAALFFSERAGCTLCHAGANFTDERYHNIGVGMEAVAGLAPGSLIPKDLEKATDWGRYEVTGEDVDRGAFKTPSLRNVAQTAPYMHDGSIDSLEAVVEWYADGGLPNPFASPLLRPLDLSAEEQADLVAFLTSLTGAWPKLETGRLPE